MVVERSKSFLELDDLLLDDLVSHLLTNSISVDDDLVWELTLVMVSELIASGDDASVQLGLDELYVLGVDDDIVVVSGLSLVGGGTEPDHRFLTSMADINTDDHDLLLHERRPLHSERLSSELGVDLLHDVGCNREVDLLGCELLDALTQDAKLREHLLDAWVVALSADDHDTEVAAVVLRGISLMLEVAKEPIELLIDPLGALLGIWDLDHLDLSAFHAHLALTLKELLSDILCLVA